MEKKIDKFALEEYGYSCNHADELADAIQRLSQNPYATMTLLEEYRDVVIRAGQALKELGLDDDEATAAFIHAQMAGIM